MRIAAWDNAEVRSSFLRYAIVGVGNTALNFSIYTALTRGFPYWRAHYLFANAVTFTIVVTWSFFWNKRWSFGNSERRHKAQYMKFFLVTLGGVAIEQTILAVGVAWFGILDLLAKLAASAFVVFWNFTMYRCWAFKPQADSDKLQATEHEETRA